MRTMECSCKLGPSPGMYAVTSKPFVRRTRATFRNAEFGFFGVVVYTRVHTPRFCGLPPSAGTLLLVGSFVRPLRSNWLIVGMFSRCLVSFRAEDAALGAIPPGCWAFRP